MLTLFKLKLNKNIPKKVYLKKIENDNDQTKHYPPVTKEWYNSIYAYNKNTLNLLPIADKVIIKLIKSYFNLYSKMLNYKIRYRKLRIRVRRISSHRIYVSKAEFRHTINKLIITFFIYNRQKYNFFSKIKIKIIRKKYITLLKEKIFKRKIRLIKRKGLKVLEKVTNEKEMLIKTMTLAFPALQGEQAYIHLCREKNIKNYENLYYKNFIKKCLKREMLHIYYKQILYFNKSKFENTYLHKLSTLIRNIYNKNIEFNIVSLKYFFLNSDIFSESLAIKLRKRKNRLLNVLKRSLRKVRITDLNKYGDGDLHTLFTGKEECTALNKNEALNSLNNNVNNDPLNHLLFNYFFASLPCATEGAQTKSNKVFIDKPEKHLEEHVLNSFKHKAITGVRLEAAGRLSRRLTASRSVFKIKYKGSLKNIYSSYKGLPSVMVRGNLKSNLQYSVMESKTRIGAFGLKGWVSSN